MLAEHIYAGLADKTLTGEELARRAVFEPELALILVEGMSQTQAEVKYGSAKALRLLVDEEPTLLYPYFDTFSALLHSSKNILRWEALYVLAGLACVDDEDKIGITLDDYFAYVEGPMMITAANSIKGAAVIVRARPKYAQRVLDAVLRCERGRYESTECYEIVMGSAINTFYKLHRWVSDPRPLTEFVVRHADSSREPTRKAAEKFLARYGALKQDPG